MVQREGLGQWQLETNSAEAYERYLVPVFFASWADQLLDLVTFHSGERVLDVACGTGIVARRAALRVGTTGTVTGLDLNEGMLAVARAVSSTVRPAIDWRQGSVMEMPLQDGSFEVVCCQQALQFFPDPLAALREMRRVLAVDGRLALAVLRSIAHNPAYVPLADALERHAGTQAGMMMRSPFPAWERKDLRELIAGAGFHDVHIRLVISSARYPSAEEFLRQEAASSPLAGPINALSADLREALLHDLSGALQMYTDDEGIIFPMETYMATARR